MRMTFSIVHKCKDKVEDIPLILSYSERIDMIKRFTLYQNINWDKENTDIFYAIKSRIETLYTLVAGFEYASKHKLIIMPGKDNSLEDIEINFGLIDIVGLDQYFMQLLNRKLNEEDVSDMIPED